MKYEGGTTAGCVMELDVTVSLPVTVRIGALWTLSMEVSKVVDARILSVPAVTAESVEELLGVHGMDRLDGRLIAVLKDHGDPPWRCGCGATTNRLGRLGPECLRCSGREVGL